MINFDTIRIADIVELRTWASQFPYQSSTLKEDLESVIGPEVTEDDGDTVHDKEELFEAAQQVFDEFNNRSQVLGGAYPFSLTGDSIRPKDNDVDKYSYIFCLALSQFPSNIITQGMRAPAFENVVLNAAKSYFGADGVRIGAPWSIEFSSYSDLLKRVHELVAGVKRSDKSSAPNGGDGGWDIIISKQFCDKKYPHLMAIGNCATSQSEWTKKGKDVAQDHFWHMYFTSPPRSPVLEFLAIPFLMDEGERSRKCDTNYLLFDRYRICEYAPRSTDEAEQWLQANRQTVANLSLM